MHMSDTKLDTGVNYGGRVPRICSDVLVIMFFPPEFSTYNVLNNEVYHLLWSPYVIGQAIIFSSCFFLLLLSFFFFPRLILAVGDWMSTILRHMVWS